MFRIATEAKKTICQNVLLVMCYGGQNFVPSAIHNIIMTKLHVVRKTNHIMPFILCSFVDKVISVSVILCPIEEINVCVPLDIQ